MRYQDNTTGFTLDIMPVAYVKVEKEVFEKAQELGCIAESAEDIMLNSSQVNDLEPPELEDSVAKGELRLILLAAHNYARKREEESIDVVLYL